MEKTVKKRGLDMLSGPIWNKLPIFALPVAATAILEQLFNASDVAVVGNFAGSDKTLAVAAVGANTAVIGLIINLFVGIALGANVVIANAIGRGDGNAVKRAVNTSVLISVIGGFIVCVIGEIIASPLMRLLQVPDDVFPSALLYLRIYLAGMPVILLYNFEAAIFRSVGDTKTPLIALAASGVLNVILNLFFVIVLKMTVNGVAIATVVSNALSSAVLFIRLLHTDKEIKVEIKDLKFDGEAFKKIIKIGLPAGIQGAVFALSNIIIQSAINSLGKVVMAASSAAYNIEILAYDVLNSFSQACTTFVGQNFGARKIDRCKKTLYLCLLEDLVATLSSVGLVLLFGRFLLSLFNSDPEVIDIGYTRLAIILSAYVFSMIYDVISGYLRGFGISLVPSLLTIAGVCGIRIFWISVVFPQSPTFRTIMNVYPVSLGTTAFLIFLSLLFYRPARKYSKRN